MRGGLLFTNVHDMCNFGNEDASITMEPDHTRMFCPSKVKFFGACCGERKTCVDGVDGSSVIVNVQALALIENASTALRGTPAQPAAPDPQG